MQTAIPSSVSSKLANMGFWCACLVVVSHIFVMPDSDAMTFWARDVLTRVHAIDVPFFFLAAGYFLAGHVMEWRWWEGEVFKRARTLLLPFFLWILLWLVYEQALALGQGMLDGKPPSACVSIAIGALPASFGLNPLGSPALPPLWFVRTLFCLVVLSPLLVAPIKQGYLCGRLWMGMLLAVFGLYVVVFDSPYEALFGVSSFLTVSGIFWFTLGLFLRLHPVSVPLPAWGGAMLLVATLAVEVAVVLVTPPDSMWARLVSFVGGIVLMPAVWAMMPSRAWPRWLTSAAFPIYLMHWFVLFPLAGLLSYPSTFPVYLCFVAAGILLPLAVTCALRRWLPKTACVLFGGR